MTRALSGVRNPTVPTPIFWETVAVCGLPPLRRPIHLEVTVYTPEPTPPGGVRVETVEG